MFPHATCLCVKKGNQNTDVRELQKYRYQRHKENGKQFKENSWIIHRHVDFVKITVLTPTQVSILKQVSHIQTASV